MTFFVTRKSLCLRSYVVFLTHHLSTGYPQAQTAIWTACRLTDRRNGVVPLALVGIPRRHRAPECGAHSPLLRLSRATGRGVLLLSASLAFYKKILLLTISLDILLALWHSWPSGAKPMTACKAGNSNFKSRKQFTHRPSRTGQSCLHHAGGLLCAFGGGDV